MLNQNIYTEISKNVNEIEKRIENYTETEIFRSYNPNPNYQSASYYNTSYNEKYHKETMKTYNLINKSEDSIIIYNIKKKNRDLLIADIDFFNKKLPFLNFYKENIEQKKKELNILIQKEKNKTFKTGKKLEQLESDLKEYNNFHGTINICINNINKIKKFTEYIFNGIQNSRKIPENSTPILNSNPIPNYNFKSNVDKNLRTKHLNRKNRESKGQITNKPINVVEINPSINIKVNNHSINTKNLEKPQNEEVTNNPSINPSINTKNLEKKQNEEVTNISHRNAIISTNLNIHNKLIINNEIIKKLIKKYIDIYFDNIALDNNNNSHKKIFLNNSNNLLSDLFLFSEYQKKLKNKTSNNSSKLIINNILEIIITSLRQHLNSK